MQPAKLTASRSACASLTCPPELDALDELGELEPQAAIAAAATIAAAAAGSADLSLNMTQVLSGRGSHECNTPAQWSQLSAIAARDRVVMCQ